MLTLYNLKSTVLSKYLRISDRDIKQIEHVLKKRGVVVGRVNIQSEATLIFNVARNIQ